MNHMTIQQDIHTTQMNPQQDTSINKTKTQDKASQVFDQDLRTSNDSDAVANSGESSGSSEG